MLQNGGPRIDVLMCVGARDVNYLMPYSLQSCLNNFELLNNIYIVTNAKQEVLSALEEHQIRMTTGTITVLDDEEVIPEALHDWPGWCKQQFIRLHADQICKTPIVACLSADTIIFKSIAQNDLFAGTTPLLFYNRGENSDKHYIYECERVRNIASLLRVEPTRSLPLGDFIMDLMLFESAHLKELRGYLESIYGVEPFLKILPREAETFEQKNTFGEWTLYAVFLLDVLKLDMTTRNSMNKFIAQVHSARQFAEFEFDAHVVHFVAKTFDVSRIRAVLEEKTLALTA